MIPGRDEPGSDAHGALFMLTVSVPGACVKMEPGMGEQNSMA